MILRVTIKRTCQIKPRRRPLSARRIQAHPARAGHKANRVFRTEVLTRTGGTQASEQRMGGGNGTTVLVVGNPLSTRTPAWHELNQRFAVHSASSVHEATHRLTAAGSDAPPVHALVVEHSPPEFDALPLLLHPSAVSRPSLVACARSHCYDGEIGKHATVLLPKPVSLTGITLLEELASVSSANNAAAAAIADPDMSSEYGSAHAVQRDVKSSEKHVANERKRCAVPSNSAADTEVKGEHDRRDRIRRAAPSHANIYERNQDACGRDLCNACKDSHGMHAKAQRRLKEQHSSRLACNHDESDMEGNSDESADNMPRQQKIEYDAERSSLQLKNGCASGTDNDDALFEREQLQSQQECSRTYKRTYHGSAAAKIASDNILDKSALQTNNGNNSDSTTETQRAPESQSIDPSYSSGFGDTPQGHQKNTSLHAGTASSRATQLAKPDLESSRLPTATPRACSAFSAYVHRDHVGLDTEGEQETDAPCVKPAMVMPPQNALDLSSRGGTTAHGCHGAAPDFDQGVPTSKNAWFIERSPNDEQYQPQQHQYLVEHHVQQDKQYPGQKGGMTSYNARAAALQRYRSKRIKSLRHHMRSQIKQQQQRHHQSNFHDRNFSTVAIT